MSDMDLMRDYADRHSEPAFTELVRRHLNLVYSVALRRVGNAADAQDVSQAVFIILAQKIPALRRRAVLTGWLYETTRFVSARLLRTRGRQQIRDQEAFMQSTVNGPDPDDAWRQLAPHLEEAMSRLGEHDRALLALRYFENKSTPVAAAALGINEAAAHKRADRALEKLRKFLSRRGIVLSAVTIAVAISANSVQAAPVGMTGVISSIALAKGAAAGSSTLTLVKGGLKLMAWTKAKTAVIAGVVVLLAAGTTTVAVKKIEIHNLSATNPAWADDPRNWALDSSVLSKLPPAYILRPTRFSNGGGSVYTYPSAGEWKVVTQNTRVEELLEMAYNFGFYRCVFPEDMPVEHFDFLFTGPGDYHERLKADFRSKFGLTAHTEKREEDVWRLRVKNPRPPGLKIAAGNSGSWMGSRYGAKSRGQALGGCISLLESTLGRQVIDETGLTGRYDIDVDWTPLGGQSEKDALRQAFLNQLGLELVPDREVLDTLVVEKAANRK